MLPIFSKITEISQVLDKELKRSITDYKIFVRLNIELDVYIKAPKNSPIESILKPHTQGFKINVLVYDNEEVENDPFLEHIFTNNTEKVNYGLKYRFHSLLDEVNTVQEDRKLPPVITFYSYKGGMGRTTTLASFASYYAMHYKKKVVMIDCDLEAPGFNNFFDLSAERLENRSGFVEYLIDKQAQDNTPDLENYILEVDKDFSGEGTIYVMPAGNVSTNPISEASNAPTHLQHYLEALARIDIANEHNFSNAFQDLIAEIDKKYQPDVILIDSRTGFNDIFGIAAFDLSQLVVAFFGSSEQTLPGLYYFLNYTLKIQKKFDVVLANSILPMGDKRGFKTFTKTIDDIVAEKIQGLDQVPSFQSFPITRYPLLERMGIDADSRDTFVQLITEKDFGDYNQIFEGIITKLHLTIEAQDNPDLDVDKSITEITPFQQPDENALSTHVIIDKPLKKTTKYDWNKSPNFGIGLRKKLLETLNKDYPKPYADDILFDEEFISKKFYFRPKIYNVFNADKFLIIGGKGTGKTLFYQGLRNDFFVKNLKEKAEKEHEFFLSTGAINLQQDAQKDRLFTVHSHFDVANIINYDRFFQRFWLIYVWNVIMIDIRKGKYLSNSEFAGNTIQDILDDTTTKLRFENLINDDVQIIKIEDELKRVDTLLKDQEKHLIVLFDQLDFVCKPIYWDKVIAPFVSYWRSNRFNRILPKIFLRTDLFNKLGNITNKQQLKSQSIDLEWTQEEIYAFFFKWILSTASSEFYNLMRQYKDYPAAQIDEIKEVTIKNHVPTEGRYLEPLVSTFFGKFADISGTAKFGTSYDWFYNNLKNADNTISLRPFIDLVWEGIGKAVKTDDSSSKPILPPVYFIVSEIRKKAVIRHFNDLAQEEGNKDLQIVHNHILKLAPTHALKKIYLKKREFDSLMADIIEKNPSIENKEVDKLKDLLIVNGIVAEIPVSGAYLNYRFAFLYKYFLGLK
ncbi:AAA family ATPase [Runella sp.]|jgi:MinD-like ATPase involved in chromosome partitioning or flagellar assembly|uniref:tyrosine-protein kinase family protein n=1 Tax=Runella sp. TaxID=1960881 RepID=UPI00260C5AED|nr:AAA family ATPase [Runella sp.]